MNKRVEYSNEILPEIQNEAQNFDVLKNTDDSELFFILKAKEAMVNDWEDAAGCCVYPRVDRE